MKFNDKVRGCTGRWEVETTSWMKRADDHGNGVQRKLQEDSGDPDRESLDRAAEGKHHATILDSFSQTRIRRVHRLLRGR